MNLGELGSRIRNCREKRGLKQVDIANALQISSQAVSKWERGENAPDISLLSSLSSLLGVSIEWILGSNHDSRDVFEATVMVTSVLGYSKKSLELPLPELAIWANCLLSTITESVLKFQGVPVKQLGDGILAFFSGKNHGSRAVQATFAAERISTDPLKFALSAGEIYLGNIGHPDYSQLDILGDPVNLAFAAQSWLGSQTKSAIVVTENSLAQASENFEIISRKSVELSALNKTVILAEIKTKLPAKKEF